MATTVRAAPGVVHAIFGRTLVPARRPAPDGWVGGAGGNLGT
ncbi:hypothetical protein [Isoptericola hypogeus]